MAQCITERRIRNYVIQNEENNGYFKNSTLSSVSSIKEYDNETNLSSFNPFAGVSVLLLDNVSSDGGTTVVGRLLPLEVYVVLAPVLQFGLARSVRFAYRKINTVTNVESL
jgi:hypothetical protein